MSDWQRDVVGELRKQPPDDADVAREARPEPSAPRYRHPDPPAAGPGQRPPAAPAAAVTTPPAPPHPAPDATPTNLTRERGTRRAPATHLPLRRRAADALTGLISTSRETRHSLDIQAQLTTAVPSGRRIVVLGLRPGTGSTTATALISIAVAGRRSEPVLIVDAARSGTNRPLAPRLGVQPGPTLSDLAAHPPGISSRDDLAEHLTPVGRDVWLLPGAHGIPVLPGAPQQSGPNAATYSSAVDGLSRYFDIVVTDLGADSEQTARIELLTGAHALCVVCSGSHTAITYAETLIRSLRDAGPMSWAGRAVILANVQDGDTKITMPTRVAVRRARRARVPIVLLPYDDALRGAVSSNIARLHPRTHRAALEVGALLLDVAVPDPAHVRTAEVGR